MVRVLLLLALPLLALPLRAQRLRAADGVPLPIALPESQILLDVHVTDAVHGAMMSRISSGGELSLPLQALMHLAGIRTSTHAGIISANGAGARPRFALAVERRLITVGNLQYSLLESDLLVSAGTVLVSSVLAERLLDVTIDVDLANATVVLRNASHLPAARRAMALEAARRIDNQQRASANSVELSPSHRAAVQADYSLFIVRAGGGPAFTASSSATIPGTAALRTPTTWTTSFYSQVSGRVAGGSLSGRLVTAAPGAALTDVRWSRYRPASTRVRHVLAGALDATGMTGARMLGMSIDNYPVDYSERRMMRITGRAEPGWDYAIREGSVWAGNEGVRDGSYEFRLPMTGDVARVDVVGWGPDGQERHFVRSVHAVPMRVQRGEWQYSSFAGRCAATPQNGGFASPASRCRWAAGADTRYGLRDWLVARAGVDATPHVFVPYVGAAAVLAGSLTIQGASTLGSQALRSSTWSAQFEPSPLLSLTAARTAMASGQQSRIASLRIAPLRWDGRFSLDGWFSTLDGAGAPLQIGRVAVSALRNNVRVELFGSRTMLGGAAAGSSFSGFRGNATGIAATGAPAWWRLPGVQRSWVTGSAERAADGAVRGALRLDGSTSRAAFEVARYFDGGREPGRWAFTITPRSRRVRQTTTLVHTDAGSDRGVRSSVLHGMSGSMAWEAGRARITLSADPAANRGAINGRTFLDLDDDGVQDRAEPLLPDVPVHIANRVLVTDSLGRFRSEHMTAGEMVQIAIDSTALPSPCWRPAAARWRVRATESGLTEVMLPLRSGGILEGRIVREGAGAQPQRAGAVAWSDGLQLRAVSAERTEAFDLDVFGAGTFYMLGIPFGSYDLTMAEDDQRREGIRMTPMRVEVARPADGDLRSGAACPVTSATVRTRPRERANSLDVTPAPATSTLRDARSSDTVPATHALPRPLAATQVTVLPVTHGAMTAPRPLIVLHADTPRTHTRVALRRPRKQRFGARRTWSEWRAAPACAGPGRLEVQTAWWSLLGCQNDAWRRDAQPIPPRRR